MTEFIPQAINIRGAIGDSEILADALCKDLKPGTLLDIGCGEGFIAIDIAKRRPDINILGIDVDTVKCAAAQINIENAKITDRVQIMCADVFKTHLPISDAICCNPPLLPAEQGFFTDEGISQNLFWKILVEKIHTEEVSPLIYLHLFDFHGINHRTGKLPSLEEVASTTGFSMAILYRGIRQIGENSRVRYNLPELADYFPEGSVIVDDSEVLMYTLSNIYINTVANLSIHQSIIRLSRSQ
ncbi:MAG: methyltransferase [Patescibacteria group bacterium]